MNRDTTKRRSRILEPDFHRGRKAPNEGGEFPAEELSEDDVNRLLASLPRRAEGVRNKVLTTLVYRADLKWVDLRSLYRRHYTADNGVLAIPARASKAERRVQLDHVTREALDEWVETRKRLRIGPAKPFFCATMKSARGNPMWPSSIRTYLSDKREELENPQRHATSIGLTCREAFEAFADDLVAGDETARDAGTIDKLRAAIRARYGVRRKLPANLNALVAYCGSVNDLVQRQTHGARKEGESLTREDARRLLFQAMFVLAEIDRALAESGGAPNGRVDR